MTDQPLALTVEQGLHAEQDLLAAVCRGEREFGVLFWRPTDHALVMPRRMSRLENFEAACAELAIAGWPVLLRETGGEPVPQSHATVNVALVYVAPRSEGDHGRIENAYERLCLPLCEVLREWGGVASVGEIDGAFCDGRYNVNLNGRKLVGTAQRWRQGLGGKSQGVDAGFRTKSGMRGQPFDLDLYLVSGRGADDHMIVAGGIQGVAEFCLQLAIFQIFRAEQTDFFAGGCYHLKGRMRGIVFFEEGQQF